MLSDYDITKTEYNKAKNIISAETIEDVDFNEDVKKTLKIDFQLENGSEDEFITISEEDGVTVKLNAARGIFRIVENNQEYDLEYFKTIDSLDDESLAVYTNTMETTNDMARATPSRPGAWKTQGPDKANLKVVKGSTRDTITAWHPMADGKPASKTYTKATSNWYSGYTKGYYDNVQNARRSYGTYRSNLTYASVLTAAAVAATFLSAGTLGPTVAAVSKVILKSFPSMSGGSATIAAGHLVSYLGHISAIIYNYSKL